MNARRQWPVWASACYLGILTLGGVWAQQPAPEAAPTPDTIVAEVDGKPIRQSSLARAVQQEWGMRILDRLIRDRLIFTAAQKRGLTLTTEDLDRAVTAAESDYPTKSAFARALKKQGLTPASFRWRTRLKLLLQKLIEQEEKVTDEQIRQYYEQHPQEFKQPAQIEFEEIVCADIQQAYRARQRLVNGEDFAKVAVELSQAPSKVAGGARQAVTKQQLANDALWDALWDLKEGDISAPIDTGDAYYVVRVNRKQEARELTLADAKSRIAKQLAEDNKLTPDDMERLLIIRSNIKILTEQAKGLELVYEDMHKIRAEVEGRTVELPQPLEILPTGTMIGPVRPLLEELGIRTYWDPAAQMVRSSADLGPVELVAGSKVLRVGRAEYEMPAEASLRHGMMYAPVRAVVEMGFGGQVKWLRARRTLKITGPPEEGRPVPARPEQAAPRQKAPEETKAAPATAQPGKPAEAAAPKPAEAAPAPEKPQAPAVENSMVMIQTKKGDILIKLFDTDAPETVANFLKLTKEGFYDGLTFHVVEPGYFVQGGDPKGNGTGGPGYTIKDEVNQHKHVKGAVAMAKIGQEPDSAGSQFYICLEPQKHLDDAGIYTVFGQVVQGMDVVEKLEVGDVMQKVIVVAERKPAAT